MSALYISMAADANDQVVRRPRPGDAIGAALRGVFGSERGLPSDMAQLMRRLDRYG